MSYKNGRSYTDFRAVNLNASGGAIRFETPTTTPTTTSGERLLYADSSNNLIWDDGSTTITLGAAGGGGGSSLDAAYGIGATITVDAGTVGMSGVNEDTAILTLSGDAASAGALLLFSHSGSGNDVTGTAGWSVTAAGAATFAEVILADNKPITLGTGSDATIAWDGSLLNIAGATDFDNAVTTQGAVTVGTTLTVGTDVTVTDGSITMTDADNAATLSITNNTATTAAGVVLVTVDGLTSGTGIRVDSTAAGMTTGNFYDAYDGAAIVWEVGDNGATTIAGAAGSDMITITAGDVLISDGAIILEDADNSVSLGITNDTATTSDVVQFTGSGTFTGTGASGFVAITQSGLTTGEALTITTDAQTTGNALSITGGGASLASGGSVARFNMGAATDGSGLEIVSSGVYSGTVGLLNVAASSATTGNIVVIDGTGLTEGSALLINATTATLTSGFYIECNDGAASDFTVGDHGATVIAGTAAGTTALTVTAGDVIITDTDGSTITSVDGAGSTLTITNGGAAGADKAALEVVSTGTSNADSAVVRITQDSLTGASFCVNLKQDDLDVGFINFEGTATADALSPISTHGTPGATTDFVRVAINGTKAWIAVSTNDPSA